MEHDDHISYDSRASFQFNKMILMAKAAQYNLEEIKDYDQIH